MNKAINTYETDVIHYAEYGWAMRDLDARAYWQSQGGHYLRMAHTAPEYQLYSVEHEVGLYPVLQAHVAAGGRIRTEVWALPVSVLPQLMQRLGPYRALGWVTFTSGPPALAMVATTDLAGLGEEISRYGGWERYLVRTGKAQYLASEKRVVIRGDVYPFTESAPKIQP